MKGAPVEVLPARAAAVDSRHIPRGMGWVVMYLTHVTSAAGAWMIALRDGRVDPELPLVRTQADPGDPVSQLAIGGLTPAELGLDPDLEREDVILSGEPVARDGLSAGMLLVCRHEGEPVAVAGFLSRAEGSLFPPAAVEAVSLFGPVAGHGLVAMRKIEDRLGEAQHAGLALLTNREVEVASLTARGASNSEVAAALGVSPGTVKSHLHRVYTKLGVSSRTGLAHLFASIPAGTLAPAVSPQRARTPGAARPDRGSP